jgi:hypothetical protein
MINEELTAKDEISMKTGKGVEDGLKLLTNMHLILRDENGNVKDERRIHNTVTTAGKNAIADQILAAPALVKMGWMAVGTGSPAATLLGAETARVAFTLKTRSNAVVTVQGDYPAGTATGALTEAGTFDVVTANTVNMWMSASFSVINKGALDTLSISWTLTIA